MEPELSGIFWVKMVAKNVVLGSSRTHFMHMRVSARCSTNVFMTTLWNISPKSRIVILATEELYGNSLIDSEKYMQRRIESPVKNVKTINLFHTTSSCTKQKIRPKHDSEIAYYVMLALLIVNLSQPLVAGNESCSGKSRFLKCKYSQMITWKQAQSLKKHPR